MIDTLKTLLTLVLAAETSTTHLNSVPPSEARTEISLLADPKTRAGDSHLTCTETALLHLPGEHLSLFPGFASPINSGSSIAMGAVLFTATDLASTAGIPIVLISFS